MCSAATTVCLQTSWSAFITGCSHMPRCLPTVVRPCRCAKFKHFHPHLNYTVRPIWFAHSRMCSNRAPTVLIPCSYGVAMERFNLIWFAHSRMCSNRAPTVLIPCSYGVAMESFNLIWFAHARMCSYRAPTVLLPCSYGVAMESFNLICRVSHSLPNPAFLK